MERGQRQCAPGSNRRGAILIRIARHQLTALLGGNPGEDSNDAWSDEPWLLESGAVFVTLRRHGTLRGCVGSIKATLPLIEDLRRNAIAAATRDSRFSPLEAAELGEVTIEISLLSTPEPLTCSSESDALAQLRPGEDGVVLHWGGRQATFLPQVWETLSTPEAFVAQLKKKAGLAPDIWDDKIRLERYRVQKWCESDVDAD